jgi:hypothetical protein
MAALPRVRTRVTATRVTKASRLRTTERPGSFDLIGELLAEHSRLQAARIARWAAGDPRHFCLLVDVFAGPDPLLTRRSAWVIGLCSDSAPELIPPHLRTLLRKIEQPGLHDAAPRNILRALMKVPIPDSLIGRIVNLCTRFLSASNSAIAVRCEALYVLARVAKKYPDLRQELRLLAVRWEHHESPGIRAAVRKILAGRPGESTNER